MIIEKTILNLVSYVSLNDIFNNFKGFKDESIDIIVKLIERKDDKLMNDISCMFQGINTLSPRTNFNEFNTENIKYMVSLFDNCSSNNELPDISNFNTKNVINMSYMFSNCNSLYRLPDISKWNTEKLIDVSHMFHNSESLTSLPDISKWNMNNINKMNEMFKNCRMLKNWPNLSRWKIKKEAEADNMFQGCTFLELMLDENNSFKTLKKIVNTAHSTYIKLENPSAKICMLITLYFFGALYFIPTFYSIKLNELEKYVSNPIKNFDLMKFFNISHIAESKNISNLIIITEDKEAFINKEINFTKINKDIKFEKSAYNIKVFSIFHGIICIFKFIILIGNRFILKKLEEIGNQTYSILYLSTLFLLNILSIILELLISLFINRLQESFLTFINEIGNLFQVRIKNHLYFSYIIFSNNLNIFVSVIFIAFIISLCRKPLNQAMNTSIDFISVINKIHKN